MCIPHAVVAAALSVASTGLSIAQSAASHREAKRAAAAKAEAVRARAVADYEKIQSGRASERDAASRDLDDSRRKALAARERAAVASREAGVTGGSAAARQRSLSATEGRHSAALASADLASERQARNELHGVEIGAQAQRSTIERPRVPNYWSQGLELASGVSKLRQEINEMPRSSK